MPPKKRTVPAPTSERAISTALKKIYYSPSGYVGVDKLRERLKEKGINATRKLVSDWLKEQKGHSLTFKPKPVKEYLRFESAGCNDKHMGDLAFFRHNSNNYTAVFVVIDVYSRYAQAVPIKDKTASNITKQYQKMLKDSLLKMPRQFISDAGSEFKGQFAKLLKDNNVDHHVATPLNHNTTSIIDRFIYLMKERIVRQMNATHNDNWSDMISGFIEGYNKDLHSTINVRPVDVMLDKVVPFLKERTIKKLPLLKKGQKVRLKLTEDKKGVNRNRSTDREYWTKESYKIESAHYSPENIRYYYVEDSTGEKNKHLFYHNELLPIVK